MDGSATDWAQVITPCLVAGVGAITGYFQYSAARSQRKAAEEAAITREMALQSKMASQKNAQTLDTINQKVTDVGTSVDGRVTELISSVQGATSAKEDSAYSLGVSDQKADTVDTKRGS